jgi:hypothetical protein
MNGCGVAAAFSDESILTCLTTPRAHRPNNSSAAPSRTVMNNAVLRRYMLAAKLLLNECRDNAAA